MDIGTPTEGSETPEAPSRDQPADSASNRTVPGAESPIDPGILLREAWTIFAAAWPACLVVYWAAGSASWLLLYLLTMILAGFNAIVAEREIMPLLRFIEFVGLVLIPAWLWVGQTIGFLKLARRQPVALEDLFRGGPFLLTTLLAGVLLLAVAAVPCLLIYGSAEAMLALGGGDSLVSMVRALLPGETPAPVAAFESTWLVLLGVSLSVVGLCYAAFLVVTARLGQFPFLIIDRGAGVFESMRMSMQRTERRAITVFLVYLAQLTINLAGLMVCYVGLFVTLPLTSLISAVTYNALCGDPLPADTSEISTWSEDDPP